jgi:hypothetical protein
MLGLPLRLPLTSSVSISTPPLPGPGSLGSSESFSSGFSWLLDRFSNPDFRGTLRQVGEHNGPSAAAAAHILGVDLDPAAPGARQPGILQRTLGRRRVLVTRTRRKPWR